MTELTTRPPGQVRAIDEGQMRLLHTLMAETVEGLHKQEPDSRPFDELAQKAGLAIVGEIATNTAMSAMAFRNLEKYGYVERVQDPNGSLRYRISRLGERFVFEQRLNDQARLVASLEHRLARQNELHQEREEKLHERVAELNESLELVTKRKRLRRLRLRR